MFPAAGDCPERFFSLFYSFHNWLLDLGCSFSPFWEQKPLRKVLQQFNAQNIRINRLPACARFFVANHCTHIVSDARGHLTHWRARVKRDNAVMASRELSRGNGVGKAMAIRAMINLERCRVRDASPFSRYARDKLWKKLVAGFARMHRTEENSRCATI